MTAIKRILLTSLLTTSLPGLLPAAKAGELRFGVIAHTRKAEPDEASLKRSIAQSNDADLAFVVVNGIKSNDEPCSDQQFTRRKNVVNNAENGVIVSLAASDWSDCKSASGKSNAIERLNRLRELFFADEFSLGASKIPVTRLSASPQFRSYAENARWELGHMLFATINLPASNNRFRPEAGRNSEFEDRMVANRNWLKRLFFIAGHKHYQAIVLFSDGDLLTTTGVVRNPGFSGKRDGFAEVRQAIMAFSGKFKGKVLLIDGQAAPAGGATDNTGNLTWRGNVGHVSVVSGWLELIANPASTALFTLKNGTAGEKSSAE
jgi:hypothetical protein